ncbi:hypothetical protein V865_000055 [Kwoniella europaea PYCC6329]|uniref:BTB domain-containing protein n=1 Tax=Kwoniella europaea PYCC6329 TaxID=1423913 RepID=A0AAX4K8N8_9TREE
MNVGREEDAQMEVDEQGQEDETNADQDGHAQDLDYSHSHSHTSHFSIRQDSSIHPQEPFPSSSSSSSTSSTLFSNPNVHSLSYHIITTLTSEPNQSNSNNNNHNNDKIDKTDNQRLVASSPSYTHIEHNSFSSNPTSVQHAQSLPPILSSTQNPFTAQSHSTPVPISQFTPSHNNNRPVPLRLTSSASSSSASSIRSARRLNHSPYIVPQTAKLISPSPKMSTPNGLVTVKDEPRTPVPLSSSPLFEVKNEPIDHNELLSTPQASRSVHSGRIGSSPGSMSMSQRRGVRPAFPSPRMIRTGSAQSNSNNGIGSTRGLLTPQYSSSSSKHPPYPSPIPPISAPLSPPVGTGSGYPSAQRWHQSAPAVPLSATIPSTNQNQNGTGKSKSTPNPYQVSLDEIPKDFVLKKLVQLASKYWYAPHSADCHIIVPLKRASRSPAIPSTPRTAIPPLHQRLSTQPHVPQTANNGGPILHAQPGDSFFGPSTPTIASIQAAAQADGGLEIKPDVLSSSVTTMEGNRDISGGRRGSLPGGNQLEQCLVFPLHKDYLTTQSVLFRKLLNCQAAHLPNPPPRDSEGRLIFQSPVIRGAKVLPTKSDRPKALYVPLPDPASLGVILHWLYWHDADHFNHCLSKGLVTWQGVIRNIEYLSLDNEIKLLAGKWWKRWVKPTEPTERRKAPSVVPSLSSKGKGKRRAFSTSAAAAAKREMTMNIDDDDDDDEEYEDEEDSGDEADDEDIEDTNGRNIKVEREDEGLADHVSLRLGRL